MQGGGGGQQESGWRVLERVLEEAAALRSVSGEPAAQDEEDAIPDPEVALGLHSPTLDVN